MHEIVEFVGVDESTSCLKKEAESVMNVLKEKEGQKMAEWFK